MQLSLATWHEVEDYLRISDGIIVPIGATEQHGPTGLIGTDHLCAAYVSRGVGDLIGCAVAPTLNYGMSQHHLGFAGSVTLRPSTLMLVVRDVVQSLAVHGFRHFFFINGHGGNDGAVTAAFDEIYAEASLGAASRSVRCCMVDWYWAGESTRALGRGMYGDANGNHASAAEVALTQHHQPNHIKHAQMAPKIALPYKPFFDAAHFRGAYADGRIGSDPSLATPDDGRRLYEASIGEMVRMYEAFMEV